MTRFAKWLKIDKHIDSQSDDPRLSVVKTLMKLYAHQSGAIQDL
jgi:hypothetical protein